MEGEGGGVGGSGWQEWYIQKSSLSDRNANQRPTVGYWDPTARHWRQLTFDMCTGRPSLHTVQSLFYNIRRCFSFQNNHAPWRLRLYRSVSSSLGLRHTTHCDCSTCKSCTPTGTFTLLHGYVVLLQLQLDRNV